jgi:hypothetical protein
MDSMDVCMPRYQSYENRWRNERRKRSTKSDKTFARWVTGREWVLRGKDPKRVKAEAGDHNCGHIFLNNLRNGSPPHANAKFYAMTAFEAHHNLDSTDYYSANTLLNMYLVYDNSNTEQISYWRAKRNQRKAKVEGKVSAPSIGKKKKFTVYDYGDTPEEYVPPIPNLPANRALRVKMEKITPGMLH